MSVTLISVSCYKRESCNKSEALFQYMSYFYIIRIFIIRI